MDISLAMQKKSMGYIFYCPSCAIKIVESQNGRFLENDLSSGSSEPWDLVFEENHNIEPTLESSSGLIVSLDSHQDLTIEEALIINKLHHEDIPIDPVIQHPQQKNIDITLRRSTREMRRDLQFLLIVLCTYKNLTLILVLKMTSLRFHKLWAEANPHYGTIP